MIPEEILHIAYNELVEIEPMTMIPDLNLLEGRYNSVSPLEITRIPLYAALLLKRSNMCKIRLPSYLELEDLKRILDDENRKMDEYSYIHPHFFSLADELLDNCYNAEDVDQSKILVEKIKEMRFKKTLQGIRCLDGRALNLNNMTMFEFNEVKEVILGSMSMGKRMSDVLGSSSLL